ncbi:hypothetical protein J2Z42_001357 [Clostridium algifaecis]|uniref:ParB-like N-terminal domain-containing protein n=1 Tax=Clostridium algifaecis TaxID=1472040 RepID=A0ABS4KRM3_9CLOT|nr:hypothetical protein [Clostridium algifaecis]
MKDWSCAGKAGWSPTCKKSQNSIGGYRLKIKYKKLKRSIETFGYVEPVIWNKKTGNIVGGHQRFKVLKQEGAKEIECVVVDISSDEEKALNVALNKVSTLLLSRNIFGLSPVLSNKLSEN